MITTIRPFQVELSLFKAERVGLREGFFKAHPLLHTIGSSENFLNALNESPRGVIELLTRARARSQEAAQIKHSIYADSNEGKVSRIRSRILQGKKERSEERATAEKIDNKKALSVDIKTPGSIVKKQEREAAQERANSDLSPIPVCFLSSFDEGEGEVDVNLDAVLNTHRELDFSPAQKAVKAAVHKDKQTRILKAHEMAHEKALGSLSHPSHHDYNPDHNEEKYEAEFSRVVTRHLSKGHIKAKEPGTVHSDAITRGVSKAYLAMVDGATESAALLIGVDAAHGAPKDVAQSAASFGLLAAKLRRNLHVGLG